eukprot:1149014-Pelagomonas_calceolata.AAC.2
MKGGGGEPAPGQSRGTLPVKVKSLLWSVTTAGSAAVGGAVEQAYSALTSSQSGAATGLVNASLAGPVRAEYSSLMAPGTGHPRQSLRACAQSSMQKIAMAFEERKKQGKSCGVYYEGRGKLWVAAGFQNCAQMLASRPCGKLLHGQPLVPCKHHLFVSAGAQRMIYFAVTFRAHALALLMFKSVLETNGAMQGLFALLGAPCTCRSNNVLYRDTLAQKSRKSPPPRNQQQDKQALVNFKRVVNSEDWQHSLIRVVWLVGLLSLEKC